MKVVVLYMLVCLTPVQCWGVWGISPLRCSDLHTYFVHSRSLVPPHLWCSVWHACLECSISCNHPHLWCNGKLSRKEGLDTINHVNPVRDLCYWSRNCLPFRSTWIHPRFSVGSCYLILILCVCFVYRCLSFCPFFIWPLYFLSFFDLRILITHLISLSSCSVQGF